MPAFSVSRSIQINQPIDRVHAAVRDFSTWRQWSPWIICEPDAAVSLTQDGKSQSWDGKVIGAGTMTVTSEDAPLSIYYRLQFTRPFKSTNTVQFAFAEQDKGTHVTWHMEGQLPFFLFFLKNMMSAWVGMDYDRGLAMLKDCLETGQVPSKLEFPGARSAEGFAYVGRRNLCAFERIGPAMEVDFTTLEEWMKANNVEPVGPPFSIYHKFNLTKGTTEYTSGFPVAGIPSTLGEKMVSGHLPGGPAYQVKHIGAYRHLGNAWSAGMAHERAKLFAKNKKVDPYEIYENDPAYTEEQDLVTTVHFPTQG
jgi:effector-binding domain-containing protein